MAFGVTPTGFSRKTLSQIKQEIEEDQRNNISSGLNQTATSVLGQLNGIISAQLDELWQLSQALYAAQYPDSASGAALDDVANIVGITRLSASKSQVSLLLNLEAGVTVPLGSVVSLSGSGDKFVTKAAVTNVAAFATNVTVDAEASVEGPIEAAPQSINTIETPVSGWSSKTAIISGNSEPYSLSGKNISFELDPPNVSSLLVTFTTENTAALVAARINSVIGSLVTATDAGGFVRVEQNSDVPGNSIEVVSFSTALADFNFPSGVQKGFNALAASRGRLLETDSELRLRRSNSLKLRSAGTLESIRSGLNQLNTVSTVQVFENVSLVRDNNGRSAKSFEVIIQGGVDQEIADKIFELKPAGIETSTSAPRVFTSSVGDFAGLSGTSLNIDINGSAQTPITFTTESTAEEVAFRINTQNPGISGATAIARSDKTVLILHDTNASGETLQVTGGTANDILKFDTGLKQTTFIDATVNDSQGFPHSIKFVRPTIINIFVKLKIVVDSRTFPINGIDQVKDAIVNQGNLQKLGEDVFALRYKCVPISDVSGVLDISEFFIGTSASPTASSNIVISSDSLAVFTLANIDAKEA